MDVKSRVTHLPTSKAMMGATRAAPSASVTKEVEASGDRSLRTLSFKVELL